MKFFRILIHELILIILKKEMKLLRLLLLSEPQRIKIGWKENSGYVPDHRYSIKHVPQIKFLGIVFAINFAFFLRKGFFMAKKI